MTYTQYLAHCQRAQRRYIANEQKRNAKLMKLWQDYAAKASKLGFHPLSRREIEDRAYELRDMLARVEETHGDTPAQRALFEMRRAEAIAAHGAEHEAKILARRKARERASTLARNNAASPQQSQG